MVDCIFAGADYPVPFSIEKGDGNYLKASDLVEMYATIYGVNGETYANYSLTPTGDEKSIQYDGDITFTVWIDSDTTVKAVGQDLRCMVNAISLVDRKYISDQRCNTPYVLTLPKVEQPPVTIKK